MGKNKSSQNVVTPLFTASFPAILEPKEDMNGNMKYSVTMLFPKDSSDMSKLGEMVKALAVEAFGKDVNLAYIKTPVHDGDEPNTKGIVRDEQKGHWVMRASSLYKPAAFNADKSVIQDPSQIYAGVQMVAVINFFAFDRPDGRGISCGLRGVTKIADGEPIGGGSTVSADEFGELPTVEGAANMDHVADWMS